MSLLTVREVADKPVNCSRSWPDLARKVSRPKSSIHSSDSEATGHGRPEMSCMFRYNSDFF